MFKLEINQKLIQEISLHKIWLVLNFGGFLNPFMPDGQKTGRTKDPCLMFKPDKY